MVEGPGVHRVAIAHRRLLLGKAFAATSPSGRFAEGAKAVDGRYLSLIEAHGKNIFYFFTSHRIENVVVEKLPKDVVVVHIHFGMSGSFKTFTLPGPEPGAKTRLRLENREENLVAHLSAQLCVHGDVEMYRERISKLGPDPLRGDADKELVWTKMQKSKTSIAKFIMDQSLIAGIGNIYRTEILFVSGVHPDQRTPTLTRATFEAIWGHSVRLLKLGVAAGFIITVSPEEAGKPYSKLKSGERLYVYSHETCRRCGGVVRRWKSAARNVYACEVCQPLNKSSHIRDNEVALKLQSEKFGPTDCLEPTKKHSESLTFEKKVSGKQTKKAVSTIFYRKRKILSGRIVEHQALKDIPTGGLVDFPSSLDDLTWPSVNQSAGETNTSVVEASVISKSSELLDIESLCIEQGQQTSTRRQSSRKPKKLQRLGVD